MVMATMSNISDSDQKSVKEIFGLLSVVFGEGGKAVPEQRVFEALKNNDMNSDRAFTELEEELKRATWDTIPTKMKKKSDRSSQGGNRDINYNNRNNQAYTSGRGRGTPALRGGGTDMGRGRPAPNAPRNDDGYRARPRQDGGRAPVGQDGRGAGWGRPPANTVPRVGPLGEVQATSNSTSQVDDIQKTDPSLAQLSSIQTLPQTDAPIPPNQWSKGRPRTEEDIPRTAMQAVVEPIPTQIQTPSNLPQPTQIPTQAPAQAPEQASRPAMPAWSNAAQSRSIVADATSKLPEVSVAADVPAPLESLSSHEEEVSTPSNFTDMTGLDATFATMGFSDGGGQGTEPATTAPEVAVPAVSQEMSYPAAWSDGAQEQSVASAAKPQDSPPQPAQPVPQAQDQQAMHQMPSQLQGGQQLSQAPPAQTQAQVPAATEDYSKQAYSGYGEYGMAGGDYGAYGMDSSASRAMGRNGAQQVQGTPQSYSMAGGSSSASEQQMPGNAQWQQQANMMAANWMQYPGYNMAAPPQNFMFMQYPGYNPMNQMYSGQNYTQASGMQQQQQQQQTTKGGYGNQHAKKQQGYNNQGYGGNAFSGGGLVDGGAGASQDYYKSQASAAFPGGTGGYGGMYAPGMYGGMPSMPAGMDAMGAFGQQGQQSAFPMRGATAAAPTSSMAGGGRGMDMTGAYGSYAYMGYGEGEAKTGWGN